MVVGVKIELAAERICKVRMYEVVTVAVHLAMECIECGGVEVGRIETW